MVKITTTAEAAKVHGVKTCVHGRSGIGKTTLVATLEQYSPILISAESGVLSLGHLSIPQITIDSYGMLEEVYQWLAYSTESHQYGSAALDSVSEIAENCLSAAKESNKDGRAAYGEMGDSMRQMIRKFRDLPGRHIYFSAKQGFNKDDVTGISRYGPSMPGAKLTGEMPYFFDELFSMEIIKDGEGVDHRVLRTTLDLQYEAKDRSGALDQFEAPHLGNVINKIMARNTTTEA